MQGIKRQERKSVKANFNTIDINWLVKHSKESILCFIRKLIHHSYIKIWMRTIKPFVKHTLEDNDTIFNEIF